MASPIENYEQKIYTSLALLFGLLGGLLAASSFYTLERPQGSAQNQRNDYSIVVDRQIFHLGRITY